MTQTPDSPKVWYTIGVKRRFLPWFKKYRVFGHKTEDLSNGSRLVLSCVHGCLCTVPDVAKKWIRVYPDYNEATANQKKLKSEKTEEPPTPDLTLSEEVYHGVSEG